jgi:hypothetical protein
VSGDSSAVFTWLHFPSASDIPISDVPFGGTLAQLAAQKTGDTVGRIGISMGCGGGPYGFDGATFTQGDSSVTYDLQTSGSTVSHAAAEEFLLPAGRADSVECQLFDADQSWYEVGDLTLQAKSPGSGGWHDVATASQQFTDGVNGLPAAPRFTVTPVLNTAYRCTHGGTYPSVSNVDPVLVFDLIWATPRDVRVDKGHNIVIRGHVLPAVPGRRVTLYRGRHAVGHTRLDAGGHYRFVTPARRRGQVRFLVVTATTRRHVGGVSGPMLVDVTRR